MLAPISQSGVDDFNFLIGSWHVAHRRLKDRLAAMNGWHLTAALWCRRCWAGLETWMTTYSSYRGTYIVQ